jgi:hypothetical protein
LCTDATCAVAFAEAAADEARAQAATSHRCAICMEDAPSAEGWLECDGCHKHVSCAACTARQMEATPDALTLTCALCRHCILIVDLV